MEKINRHNYEAYFLDYLEGNLSAEEKHDLLVFLDQNPDLKKELDLDLAQVSLDPSATVFADKASLKVEDDAVLSMITVDAWMIESVEKNLTASKQQELDDFIKKHQLEKTYTAYQSTILKPDLNEVFAEKRKLKVATGIVIPMYARVAAVAAVAVFIISIAINRQGQSETVAADQPATRVYAAKLNMQAITHRNYEMNDLPGDQNNVAEHNTNGVQQKRENGQDKNQNGGSTFLANSNEKNDSLKQENGMTPDPEKIANQDSENDPKNQQDPADNDDVAINNTAIKEDHIVTEEPYKIVTNAASNVTNREVYFTRDRNTATNEYVAYGFKIGNFEFERKK